MKFSKLLTLYFAVRILSYVVLVISEPFIPDHEAEGVEQLEPWMSEQIYPWLKPFIRWDSIHFLKIAILGYTQDYQFVFFPLYPLLLRHITEIMYFSSIALINRLILFGLLFNLLSGAIAVILLRGILEALKVEGKLIDLAVLVFIFNPAHIFLMNLYSESLFVLLSFLTYFLLIKNYPLGVALVPALLACFTRSNGMFLMIPAISSELLRSLVSQRLSITSLLRIIAMVSASLLPFFLFNLYGSEVICRKRKSGDSCETSPWTSFRLYSLLQRQYWNVGFLRSFQFRQLPNILLALPVIGLSLWTISADFDSKDRYNLSPFRRRRTVLLSLLPAVYSESLLPWKLHLLALVLLGALFAHIQITTRLVFSSSPLIYLGLAKLLQKTEKVFFCGRGGIETRKAVIIYMVVYFFAGSLLHSNFYPWT